MEDISDFYIKTSRYKGYEPDRVENTSYEDVIVAKIEMILLTTRGETTDPNFGADIPQYLWKTKFPATTIQQNIQDQFTRYIPELNQADYRINVFILPGSYQDMGVVSIDLGIKNVNVIFS